MHIDPESACNTCTAAREAVPALCRPNRRHAATVRTDTAKPIHEPRLRSCLRLQQHAHVRALISSNFYAGAAAEPIRTCLI
jgi:hypothetical protein